MQARRRRERGPTGRAAARRAGAWVILHARDDVGEVCKRMDAARLGRRDERVVPGDARAGLDVADEEGILATERDTAQRPLRRVVVERHASVVEKRPSSRRWFSAYRIAVEIRLFGGCRRC